MTRESWADDWRGLKNVLAVRLDSLGDVLMTEPALRALKTSSAGRRLTLLTSPEGVEVARLMPEVDEVMVYRAPWMKPDPSSTDVAAAMIEVIRQRQFDSAVIFTVSTQNPLPAALFLRLAGVANCAAYCRENPYHLVSHWLRETEAEQPQRHEVQRHLDMVSALGASLTDTRMHIGISGQAIERARAILDQAGVNPCLPLVVVHPGASAASRRYRPDLFAAALRALQAKRDVSLVLTGSPYEAELVDSVQDLAGLDRRSRVIGQDTEVLAAIISLASVLLSNNTGPVHIAAAVGTPVVDLYALTNPQHTPWQVPCRVLSHDVACRWCLSSVCLFEHHACLDLVSPDEVSNAVCELISEDCSMANNLKA